MMKKLTICFLLLLIAATVVAREQNPKEKLVIAISSNFHPFTFLNAEGKPAGMFVDIWRLWAQKTGKKIEFLSSDLYTSFEIKLSIHPGFRLPDPRGTDQVFPRRQSKRVYNHFTGRDLGY